MMRTVLITIMLLSMAFAAHAASVTLQWNANTETDLAGYRVYQKADSAIPPFTKIQDIKAGTTTATIKDFDVSHSYSYAVTAYNASGLESAYSNIVTVPAAPKVPGDLKWALTLTISSQ